MTDSSIEDFWDHAPSGHVIAALDGRMIRVNETLSRWLGYDPNMLSGKLFSDLLTAAGRVLYETHFGPSLQMRGGLNGVAVDLVAAGGSRLPVFLTANVRLGADGRADSLQITVLDATDRRAYEA